tara:strand:+ start:58 stop:1686 length:1629 start_codon:yes stop_codon:yes gene_type:complete
MTAEDIFLGSQASLTLVPEVDLYIPLDHSNSTTTELRAHDNWEAHFLMVDNLYVGCTVELYDSGAPTTIISTHIVTKNDEKDLTISPAHGHTLADGDFIHIRGYGAPCVGEKNSTTKRLNADNWLGLVESATFPNVEVEMKQMNLQLGGGRNFTHQYKGIETASGANINLVANHGAFIYYALGRCTNVNATLENQATTDLLNAHATNSSTDDRRYVYIDAADGGAASDHDITEFLDQGPIFYKTARGSNTLVPPLLNGIDAAANMELLQRAITDGTTGAGTDHLITYTFAEADGEKLPSFALEQTMSKTSTLTTNTASASESATFVRIARGNRVNTFTMTANENEEVKMTMDLNTRAVHSLAQAENYEARAGITDNRQLFNFEQANDTSPTDKDAEFLEPFFFSSGLFSVFGQQFLKVTNLTLTINNNLQDKRFVGIGNKSVKDAIPAQRTYEVSFTAMVTDDKLFEELLNQTEIDNTASTLLTLQFDKANGEQILMKFQDYFLNSANFTIPDDKGPITVEGTVMPRTLNSCTVKTHWVLQG